MKQILFVFLLLATKIGIGQEIDSPSEIRRETNIQAFGDYAQFAPTAVSLITVIAKKDKKGFWQLTKSTGTNLALTYVLKYSINKHRPEGQTDGKAFPSGHTSFAFQGASFLQRRNGWEYGIPAYAVAAYVGWSRMEGIGERHDGWDILAGAVVGIGSTYLFTTPYSRDHFELSFESGEQSYLVGFVYKF